MVRTSACSITLNVTFFFQLFLGVIGFSYFCYDVKKLVV